MNTYSYTSIDILYHIIMHRICILVLCSSSPNAKALRNTGAAPSADKGAPSQKRRAKPWDRMMMVLLGDALLLVDAWQM